MQLSLADNTTRIRELCKYLCLVSMVSLVFCKVFDYEPNISLGLVIVSGIFWAASCPLASYFEQNADQMMRHFEQVTIERRSQSYPMTVLARDPKVEERLIRLLKPTNQSNSQSF